MEGLREEREKLKDSLHTTSNQSKHLFEENIELLKRLKELQTSLGERETYIVSLNSIIDLLREKRDFDLLLASLL